MRRKDGVSAMDACVLSACSEMSDGAASLELHRRPNWRLSQPVEGGWVGWASVAAWCIWEGCARAEALLGNTCMQKKPTPLSDHHLQASLPGFNCNLA